MPWHIHDRHFSHAIRGCCPDRLCRCRWGRSVAADRAREPAEAIRSFQVQDGFRLDLLAAEPLVTDPVAAAYDEDGRLYVVEMTDYPHVDPANDKPFAENLGDPPIGRVRLLIDRDDDGVFDESHVFADKLSWPTGIVVWKGGVFVAATPDIWYLRDNDGDHRADERRRVFTGFRKFNVQAVMNNLQWGLDHRIYGAGSSNGGLIRAAERGMPMFRRSTSSAATFGSTQPRAFSRRSPAARGSATRSTTGATVSSATSETRPSTSFCPRATWRGIRICRPHAPCTTSPSPAIPDPALSDQSARALA